MMDVGVELRGLGQIGIAALLAGVIGLERELTRRPAGLRTHVLVGVASALLIVLGRSIVEEFSEGSVAGRISVDPIRVLEAIVVGVSFLGAGTILHDRHGRVEGLTTAASILLVAGIGAAAALDRVFLAAVLTVGTTAVLFVLGRIEARLGLESPSVTTPARAGTPSEKRAGADS